VAEDSLLPDELVHQLMAVGQVDVLVGIPTLNNAETIAGVVRAVHHAFSRYFLRDRTVLVNSDGGSTDGTPAIVRDASVEEADTLTVSHRLRTTHRISTPYHGVPGKGNALRQILAAAELTQARAVAVLDPEVISITPEWIAALIGPVGTDQFDFVMPVYNRHPLDATLVTQVVRPLFGAIYGWRVREPLAAEFGCSGRFVTWALEQDVWKSELARYGIDVWITGAALAGGFRCCQAPLGPRVQTTAHTPGFQDVFQQVVGSAFSCVETQAGYWLTRQAAERLPIIGPSRGEAHRPAVVDGRRLTEAFRADIAALHTVLGTILTGDTMAALDHLSTSDGTLQFPDDLWSTVVYEFLAAYHRAVMRRDHITQALAPLYLGRTGAFLLRHADADPPAVEAALESLCSRFEQLKPALVERWNQAGQR
jgi:hypothetical protein